MTGRHRDQVAAARRSVSPADYGVPQFTVPAVLDRRAEQYPDRVLIEVAGAAVTYTQMQQRSCAAAGVLLDLGVRRGDSVALFTATCPEWIYFWLGAVRIGAVAAAVNAANRGDFLRHALTVSQAKVVLTDAERRPRVEALGGGSESTMRVVVRGDELDDALERGTGRAIPLCANEVGDVGSLFFTSGTTGASKAVATTWHYLFTAAARVTSAWDFAAGEVLWTAMPLFHLSAAATVLGPLLVGATTVLAADFRPSRVWDEVRGCGAVGFAGAGAMLSMLASQPADPGDAELSLRFISAAPVDADLHRHVEQRYRCRVLTMYGLTEAFPLTVTGMAEEGVPGTSGRPGPDFDVRIVDPDGTALPAGQAGEIVCRATTTHAMSEGYVSVGGPGDEPGLHVERHPPWFRTGDLGVLDDEGNLTYSDRVKDSLRRRGENISSFEVERVVRQHPAVLDAAVVGVPSELGEDDILLTVTLQPGAAPDYFELLDFCGARMPYFCVPRYVDIVDELPRTVIGRVRKDVLRARGVSPHAWDRESHGYLVSR